MSPICAGSSEPCWYDPAGCGGSSGGDDDHAGGGGDDDDDRRRLAQVDFLGCNAAGREPWRFCGFGQYDACPCPETEPTCGVSTCTSDVWGAAAGAYSCGARIGWLMRSRGYAELDACTKVAADEFPVECGGCNPGRTRPPRPRFGADEFPTLKAGNEYSISYNFGAPSRLPPPPVRISVWLSPTNMSNASGHNYTAKPEYDPTQDPNATTVLWAATRGLAVFDAGCRMLNTGCSG